MPLRPPRFLPIALAVGIAAVPADAATLCSVEGASLTFGAFPSVAGLDPGAEIPRDTTADLAITCTVETGATIGVEVQLDGGSSGNPLDRRLTGPGTLAYNIFADPGRNQVWGDGASGSARSVPLTAPAGSGSASAAVPLYARIARGQRNAPVGTYGDTVLVTIVY